jgi:hypothetical protein
MAAARYERKVHKQNSTQPGARDLKTGKLEPDTDQCASAKLPAMCVQRTSNFLSPNRTPQTSLQLLSGFTLLVAVSPPNPSKN